jgi:flagellar basal body-associated protein FliL
MGEYEDRIREEIKAKYGSVPKMSEATGIAATTIYHALDRGLTNTRTETSSKIIYALIGLDDHQSFALNEANHNHTPEEDALLTLFRSMDEDGRMRLMEQAEFLAARHPIQ